jgi:hypothetical protein
MMCRDCIHWQQEWYNEEHDEWCGYGCHKLEKGVVNIGICMLLPDNDNVRLEDNDACELYERRESAVDDDVANMLFGEPDD